MKERHSNRFSDRWRRAATHVAAALNLRSPGPQSEQHEAHISTPLGPLPFYGQSYNHLAARQPAPGIASFDEDRGYYRMTYALNKPANPRDYGYPVGMHGFPPPDWMLRQWEQNWDQQQPPLTPIFLPPKG